MNGIFNENIKKIILPKLGDTKIKEKIYSLEGSIDYINTIIDSDLIKKIKDENLINLYCDLNNIFK